MKKGTIFLTALSALLISSCSIFDKSHKYVVQGSQGSVSNEREEVVPEAESSSETSGPVLTPPRGISAQKGAAADAKGKKAVKNNKNKGKDTSVSRRDLDSARKKGGSVVETEALTPADSTAKSPVDEYGVLPADFTINGEWTIYSVNGNIVTGEERPYVTFDLDAGRFYGSNGCNIINGSVKPGENNSLTLSDIISTMKMCADAPYEYQINLALNDVTGYRARQEGSITFLDLLGKGGKVNMVLRRHNMDFLNGVWKITDLNGKPLVQEDDATMTINIPDLKIHGTTGCNIFNGTLFIDPDKRHSMQFVDIATTRMMCAPDSRETEFLLALESVESARATGKDTIAMYDQDGNELFKMTRMELRAEDAE